jgi:hypothetical protein
MPLNGHFVRYIQLRIAAIPATILLSLQPQLGGECNPALGTEGQSEIGVLVAAAPRDTVGFGTALSGSSSDLGGGVCLQCYWHWAIGIWCCGHGGLPR